MGWALQEEGRFAEAGEHYRTAAQLQPDLAMAELNLGGLHEELGEMAAAEASFRTALRLQPAFALPHARIATLLRGKLSAEDAAALEQRLGDEQLGPGPRARLLFALAHALDARGDYARAADCLRQANGLALELGKGRREYSPAEHEQFVDGLVRMFDGDFFARLAGAGSDTRRPVFVVGLPRSGTTLIEQVLASHSQVHGAGELRLARESFEALPAMLGRSDLPRDCLPHLDPPAPAAPGRAASGPVAGDRRRPQPSGSWTKCPTTTCIWASWRPCFRGPRSSIAAATCATWPSPAG